ncbi:hypothetical protein BH11MYX1_BH11MYX1_26180 [soil metagenome]
MVCRSSLLFGFQQNVRSFTARPQRGRRVNAHAARDRERRRDTGENGSGTSLLLVVVSRPLAISAAGSANQIPDGEVGPDQLGFRHEASELHSKVFSAAARGTRPRSATTDVPGQTMLALFGPNPNLRPPGAGHWYIGDAQPFPDGDARVTRSLNTLCAMASVPRRASVAPDIRCQASRAEASNWTADFRALLDRERALTHGPKDLSGANVVADRTAPVHGKTRPRCWEPLGTTVSTR